MAATAMTPVEDVAVLALVYRTMWGNCYEGPRALLDDMEGNPDAVSLLGMIGSQKLTRLDWGIVKFMIREDNHGSPVEIAQFLSGWDSRRCEALLHAWPEDVREVLADKGWAESYVERWELVAMTRRGLEPLTWNHEQQDDVAASVQRMTASG
jgi:hypothetical protein